MKLYGLLSVFANSSNPATIHLADGTYSPSTNGEFFPLGGKANVSIVGSSQENTILNGDSLSSIFYFQDIENVTISETTPVILKAGQLSLHHPQIVHGSGLNKSNDRRIGFAIQSYIGTNVDEVLGKIYVQQARGSDTFKYHQHVKRSTELMNENDIKTRKKANEELSKIFYLSLIHI